MSDYYRRRRRDIPVVLDDALRYAEGDAARVLDAIKALSAAGVIVAENNPPEEEEVIVDLQEVTNLDDCFNLNVRVKKRNRWYNRGRRSDISDLTIVIYTNGASVCEIDGREVTVHQTQKAGASAEETGGGVYIDDELVAVREADNLIHVLTEDKELITQIIEPILKEKDEKAKEKAVKSWKTFVKRLEESKNQALIDRRDSQKEKIENCRKVLEKNEAWLENFNAINWNLEDDLREKVEKFGADPHSTYMTFLIDPDNELSPGIAVDTLRATEGSIRGRINKEIAYARENLADRAEDYRDEVVMYKRDIVTLEKKLKEAEEELELAANPYTEEEFLASYKNLLGIEGYQRFEVHEKYVCGITNHIIVDYLDYKYDLGSFCVSVSPQRSMIGGMYLKVRVDGHEGNHLPKDYIHPHVQGGKLCAGNLKEGMDLAQADMDVVSVFTLAWLLLSIYNEDSPYLQLIHWPKVGEENRDQPPDPY